MHNSAMLTVPGVAVVAVAYTVVHMSKYTGEVEEEVCDRYLR